MVKLKSVYDGAISKLKYIFRVIIIIYRLIKHTELFYFEQGMGFEGVLPMPAQIAIQAFYSACHNP